jgi:hypothetical protein
MKGGVNIKLNLNNLNKFSMMLTRSFSFKYIMRCVTAYLSYVDLETSDCIKSKPVTRKKPGSLVIHYK